MVIIQIITMEHCVHWWLCAQWCVMIFYIGTTRRGADRCRAPKVAMNLVGDFGVQQGCSGDLLHGLPTQVWHKATIRPAVSLRHRAARPRR